MASLNMVALIGRLVKDLETFTTATGTPIVRGSIAVNDWKNKDKEGKIVTVFINFSAFGKTAEQMLKLATRGAEILVSGRLKQDSWTSSTGEKRNQVSLIAESFQTIMKKDGAEPNVYGEVFPAGSDDDIPF